MYEGEDVKNKPWKASLVIVLICLVVRALSSVAADAYDRLNRVEIVKISMSIASGQGFSNAFGQDGEPPTGPTAHVPPVYPYLLSLVYRLCGMGLEGVAGKYVLNVLFACLTFGALPFIAPIFGMPSRVGIYAGLFGALVPIYLWAELRGGEFTLVGFMLLAAAVSFRFTMLHPSFGWREAAGHGLLWGILLSTSASPAPVLVLWVGVLFLIHRPPLRNAIRFSAVLFLTSFALMLPWTVRNYLVLGSPIPSRSNLGLELQVSNNDFAMPTGYENQSNQPFDLYHPNRSPEQRLRYREIGEVAYQREKIQQAVTWIRNHPVRFVELTLLRGWFFWTAPPRRPAQMLLQYLISALAAFGLWRLWKIQQIAGMQLGALALGFSVIYYLVQFENRYRYPIFWCLLLLAAFGLTEMSWWQGLERRVSQTWARFHRGESAAPAGRTQPQPSASLLAAQKAPETLEACS